VQAVQAGWQVTAEAGTGTPHDVQPARPHPAGVLRHVGDVRVDESQQGTAEGESVWTASAGAAGNASGWCASAARWNTPNSGRSRPPSTAGVSMDQAAPSAVPQALQHGRIAADARVRGADQGGRGRERAGHNGQLPQVLQLPPTTTHPSQTHRLP
jgi:hypothetical protein